MPKTSLDFHVSLFRRPNGQPVFVVSHNVTHFEGALPGTVITTSSGGELHVSETPAEVAEILGASEETVEAIDKLS
jgi:hypothetical protein